ncbi:MAG: VIT1/CCC1 transporter family protein [Planctomycetes bacterium]|nr:VIT1/CCC1 transporter family protein [Planctomycetota bacterium]
MTPETKKSSDTEGPPASDTVLNIDPALLIENWHTELDAAVLYRGLAPHERDQERAAVLLELAESEDRHAAIMAQRMEELGIALPGHRTSLRVRILVLLARVFGARAVVPIVETFEAGETAAYLAPGQDPAVAALAGEEMTHFRTLGAMARVAAPGDIVRHERWHRTGGGGALRATIFGVSDGLVSNFALVMGFAGAQADAEFVMLAGVAGLLAGASSMGAGEYVSMRAQRELYERQIRLEEIELAIAPEEERAELVLIYRAKGVPAAEAEQLADRILENKEVALETLVREELGLDPTELGSPWTASIGSFFAFTAGAVIPVLAYFTGAGWGQFVVSATLSGMALFAVGVGVSLFTGRGSMYSGLRQLAIGAAAAGATYGIGTAIGVGTGI